MDLLKSHKRRSRLSDIAYIVLNIGLAIALLLIVRYGQTPWLAIGFVLLSKWRALAVKPRFWFANLVANMVDVIVGVSVVTLLYVSSGELVPQIGITALYAGWLLFVKPRSDKRAVTLQAGVAVFAGVTALATVSYSWDPLFMVLLVWLVGYSATRHILGNYDEPMTQIYSLIAGLIFAELTWIGHHWMLAYAVPGLGGIKIPQLAIVLTLCSFVAERAYVSYHRHGAVKKNDVLLPIVFSAAIIIVLFVFYNRIALGGTA